MPKKKREKEKNDIDNEEKEEKTRKESPVEVFSSLISGEHADTKTIKHKLKDILAQRITLSETEEKVQEGITNRLNLKMTREKSKQNAKETIKIEGKKNSNSNVTT